MARNHIPAEMPLTTVGATEVAVASADIATSVYHLADGTVVKLTPRIEWFKRHDGHYDLAGNPVYSYGLLVDFDIAAADDLKEKR